MSEDLQAVIDALPVGKLELSVRTANVLTAYGYRTIGQVRELMSNPKSQVMKSLRNFGAKSYHELRGELLRLEHSPSGRSEALELTPEDRFVLWCKANRDLLQAIRIGRAVVVPRYIPEEN